MSRATIDATAYPLQWPVGVERTHPARRERARFGSRGRSRHARLEPLTLGDALSRLRVELDRYGALDDAVISTDLRLRRTDGHPLASQRAPDDPGVAVYLPIDGVARCIPCDRWNRIADNVAAVAHALEALRSLDRWVNDSACRAVFEGFALPSPEHLRRRTWREVLDLEGLDPADEGAAAAIRSRHRHLMQRAHPDRGGSADQAAELNLARDAGLEAVGAAGGAT